MQKPIYDVVIQKSINALAQGPIIAEPSSEYDWIWLPILFLQATY